MNPSEIMLKLHEFYVKKDINEMTFLLTDYGESLTVELLQIFKNKVIDNPMKNEYQEKIKNSELPALTTLLLSKLSKK